MTASALLSLGVRAMEANYAGMQTTGHNIANAGVDGYSRQRVVLSTSQGQFTGAGFFGKGVDVETITRDYNAFLAREAVVTRGQAAYDQARYEQLSRIQDIFTGGEAGLGHATGQLVNSMVDVASRPQDLSARQVVLANADDLAQRYVAASQQIDDAQESVNVALGNAITQINELTAKIAQVNQRIAATRGSEHAPNDLLDQRGQLINELGGYLQLTTVTDASDGTVSVFVAGGQRLVLGSQQVSLKLGTDPYDSSRSAVLVQETNGTHALDTATLGSGSVAGLLRFQDEDLVKARSLIGQMVLAVGSAFNDQQAQGLDMTGAAGAALFSFGQPMVLPSSANASVSNVTLTIDDPTLVKASEYEVFYDAGAWQLRERPGGSAQALTGAPVDGLLIDLGTPPPATGNRFLLQPVARLANAFRREISDPRGIAAATATSENANALAMVALRDAPLVQRMQNPATLAVAGGSTLTDAWANAMAEVGVRVQGARTASEISATVADAAKAAVGSESGVNLDEEAANLIQFQQAYQAAAQVISVARTTFDAIIGAVR